MKKVCLLALYLCAVATLPRTAKAQDPAHATEVRMQHPGADINGKSRVALVAHRLGSDHAEGISAIDMNGDGFVDLLSGAYWYENPGSAGGVWKQHQFRTVGTHNEFVSDCGEWVVDVDHDGLPDLVTTGWIANGLFWYRNPGAAATVAGTQWKPIKIADTYDTEGGAFADINGDGKPDLALAHYNHSGVIWVDFSGATPKVHTLGDATQDGHGIGVADINGDGKADVLTPHGWFEQVDANADTWKWHGEWSLGDTGFPVLGYDVNHDGRMDLIFGQGHGYGLYWLEQTAATGTAKWVRHTIDESFSQSHALALIDLDGDGVPELVTGKRYRGHSGDDPGSYDPTVVYAYRLPTAQQLHATLTGNGGHDVAFDRITLSVNGTATIGTQVVAADFDHDGDMDFATAGKLGVHVFENLSVDHASKSAREATQPLNRTWPFPGEGPEIPQDELPAPR